MSDPDLDPDPEYLGENTDSPFGGKRSKNGTAGAHSDVERYRCSGWLPHFTGENSSDRLSPGAAQPVQVKLKRGATESGRGVRRTFAGNGDLRSQRLYFPRVSPPQEVLGTGIGRAFYVCTEVRADLKAVSESRFV
jgi:hypothetical protein